MSTEIIVFAAFVFATFFNNAIHWYTQVSTYPLFGHLQAPQFIPYHQAYEQRLTLSVYVPYGLLMISNILLFFVRPAALPLGWVTILLLLNTLITFISLILAAPVHAKLDRNEITIADGVKRIMTANSLRLLTSSASSAVLFYLLVRLAII